MSETTDTRDAAVEGAFGFVLATRDHAHGLSFWNNDYGFGPLFNATVFTEAKAGIFDVPIADDEPEWLAMAARVQEHLDRDWNVDDHARPLSSVLSAGRYMAQVHDGCPPLAFPTERSRYE